MPTNTPKTENHKFEFDGTSQGCGDFFAFRPTADKTKVIAISLDVKKTPIGDKPQTFEIGKTDSLEVYIDDFGGETYEGNIGYCNDLISSDTKPVRFTATKGKVTVIKKLDKERPGYYKVDVVVEDAAFQGRADQSIFDIPKVEIKDALVGWYAG